MTHEQHFARAPQGTLDKPEPKCGVVGIYNHPEASVMTYYALHSLQHRGQEAAGIVAAREEGARKTFAIHKGEGYVLDVFRDEKILKDTLRGRMAIGHNRYSTTGSNKRANIQPFYMNYKAGNFALAHNGNLTNTKFLRKELKDDGVIFQTTTDSEIILHLIARSTEQDQLMQVREALRKVRGAYSLTMMTDTKIIAARDPHGFRPLAIGKISSPEGDAYIVASETCAFDIVGAQYIRDVERNEIIVIDEETVRTGTIRSIAIDDVKPESRHCIFEYVYFARPDSKIFEENVDKVRRRLGENLAEEHPMGGSDVVVINVPDSSNTATLGYSRKNEEAGNSSPYEIGLIRSHYVGRTFIQPEQGKREMKVKVKFNTVKGVLKGKRVVVVDDSIVRGTTSKALVKLIREAEPAEVHLRITSPPITHPCKYGMDFPSKEELIANDYNCDAQKIGEALGADSLEYLSVEKMIASAPRVDHEGKSISYCTACFTGNYPVPIEHSQSKLLDEE